MFRIPTFLLVALTPLCASAQTLVRAVHGPAANATYGKACIRIPDQNGDGFMDLLVGAPGFNQQRGAIYCLSGAYLSLGGGTQTLWSIAPTANQGDLFGYALAEIPDATGDGVEDFLVGQPGYDSTTANDIGAVRLVDGLTHALGPARTVGGQGSFFGAALEGLGTSRVAIGAPGPNATSSRLFVVDVTELVGSGQLSSVVIYATLAGSELGACIATVPDLNGDGQHEVIVGAPGFASSAGAVWIQLSGLTPNVIYASAIAGERLGTSVDAAHDYDGDGVIDIVAGAPNSPGTNGEELGRVVVLSSARLAAGTPPYEIYTLTLTPSASGTAHFHFGAAVRASGDLNGDGIGEILAGAPDYFANPFTHPGRGFASIYSGASGSRLTTIFGANHERIGDSLTGALQDFEGDGFKEFVVAGWSSDTAGTDSGVVKCYRLFPVTPTTYCIGKVNSLGCTPAIGHSGSPQANSATPFAITASNVISQKSGLLFYSHAPTAVAFQGGLKCVASPAQRTLVQNSGGSPSGADCTGTYSFDFNAWISGGTDPSLAAGAEVYAQYWSRDPASASTTSLSNALRFLVNP